MKKIKEKRIFATDHIGKRFGKLVIKSVFYEKNNHNKNEAFAVVDCDCGSQTIKRFNQISTGKTKSCGCYRRELKPQLTHGLSKSRTYRIWRHMINRCHLKSHPRYKEWGGRGITVCDSWLNSFENFYADMGEAVGNLSIDRIDNDKGYYKENCRWATIEQQAQNKRRHENWGIYKRKDYNIRFQINKIKYVYRNFETYKEAIEFRDRKYAELILELEKFGII